MAANPHSPVYFRSPEARRVWFLLAGLALAPLPILHAYPIGFLYCLFEPPPPGWTRLTSQEVVWFMFLGAPLAPIFLTWALPGVGRPGVPKRFIVVLCCLVAYNPVRPYLESHFYGDAAARIANIFSWSESPIIWSVRNLDTPLLIGLVATALLRRHTLWPLPKILFHWIIFVCALWAAGPSFDSVIYKFVSLRFFGI
jgi:hypothetical protein